MIEEHMKTLTNMIAIGLLRKLEQGEEIDINKVIEDHINDEIGFQEMRGFSMQFDKKGRVRTLSFFPDAKVENQVSQNELKEKQELKDELMSEEERSRFSKNFYKRTFNKDHPAEPAKLLTTSANETTEEDETGSKR